MPLGGRQDPYDPQVTPDPTDPNAPPDPNAPVDDMTWRFGVANNGQPLGFSSWESAMGQDPGRTQSALAGRGGGGLSAILGSLLSGGSVGAAPSLPGTIQPSTTPPAAAAPATGGQDVRRPDVMPRDQGGLSPALGGVLTGAGGTPGGGSNIQQILAQLLKRPRVPGQSLV